MKQSPQLISRGDDDPVARLQIGDLGTQPRDDPHRVLTRDTARIKAV
jgi:hypothetical protein